MNPLFIDVYISHAGCESVQVWQDQALLPSRAGGVPGETAVSEAPPGQSVCAASPEGLAGQQVVWEAEERLCVCSDQGQRPAGQEVRVCVCVSECVV